MSRVAIRAAMETALAAMSPGLATAWQNVGFVPVAGTAYQKVDFIWARPVNDEKGTNAWLQEGIMQVTLRYLVNEGTGASGANADLLVDTFKRGSSYTSGGITVTVSDVPEEMAGFTDGDRWAVPVRVRFFAQVP